MDNREKVQQRLEETKASMAEKLTALGERAGSLKAQLSLQHQMDTRPWVVLGGSLLAGMLVSRLLYARSMPRIAAAIANAAWLSAAEPLKEARDQLKQKGHEVEEAIRERAHQAIKRIDHAAESGYQLVQRSGEKASDKETSRRSALWAEGIDTVKPLARTLLFGIATAFLKQAFDSQSKERDSGRRVSQNPNPSPVSVNGATRDI
ncbi:MAG: hypothetical protein H6715_02890 [Myxococcales bacterium]|nr:hypothetical protein [Myxococcales bacterium]MCB9708190.1 hypothetical protein [Myxococcales bacterium]